MTIVSPDAIRSLVLDDTKASTIFERLETDRRIQSLLQMANVMAVTRLRYNDHGPTHSRIVSGSALAMLRILEMKEGVTRRGGVGNVSDSRVITLCGAYLHDMGNAIHRDMHHITGCVLANPLLEDILQDLYPERGELSRIRSEILHCIISHEDDINCLSLEAGISKTADGTDMAQGRAQVAYRLGKADIHSLSALTIERVEITEGLKKPVRVSVHMSNAAGVFQVENGLMKKLYTSGIANQVEVVVMERGKELRLLTVE